MMLVAAWVWIAVALALVFGPMAAGPDALPQERP